MKDEQVHAVC